MAKNDVNWWLIGGIAVLAYFLFVGNPFAGDNGGTDVPTNNGGTVTACQIEDVTFTPKMTRLGKAGTTLSGASENFYILTDNLGSTNGGSTVTVPTNYRMQVMYGEASSTYYTLVKTVDTGCSDPKFDSVQLAYADTALNSFYAKNADGSVNSASNDQPMGADDEFETTITIKAGADTYFGNPNSDCDNIGIVEFDKTYIQSVEGDDPVAVPGSFAFSNTTKYDGSAAFIIPKTADGAEASFNVKIVSTGTQPDGTNDPILYVKDCDIDKNEDTLELIEGVEDEDLNSISLASQSLTIALS